MLMWKQFSLSTTQPGLFRLKLAWLFTIGLVFISACSPQNSVTLTPSVTPAAPTSTLRPTPKVSPTPLPSATQPSAATPLPTQLPAPQRSQVQLEVRLNYNRHSLAVSQTYQYVNNTGQDLSDLLFVVDANTHPGAFKLTALKIGTEALSAYSLENNQLKINLPAPLAAGQSLRVGLTFDLNLPLIPPPSNTVRASIFGYSARQVNLVDWYPHIPPYQPGKGWLVHNPWFFGEHQVYEKSDFTVDLTLVDPPANLKVAAAAQAEIKDGHYRFTHPNARNFTFSASNMYQVFATVVGGISITSYVFSFDAQGGHTALTDAAQALELYNRLFGAYIHPSLAVVEADFHDGMEYDGLYFLSKGFYSTYDGTPKGYLTMIGVHETAHQWWYARIANDQALEPWLDEALATYSEYLFYSSQYPDLKKWWWDYRVDYFQPAGWINQRIYDYAGSYPYRDSVYLQGARFLDKLRQRVGDEIFFGFIKDYALRNQDRIATRQDFFDILKLHTSVDITDLVKIYFKP